MVLGAVWCPLAKTKDISHKLKEIKKNHNLCKNFELKWTKVSPAKVDYYINVVSYFFNEVDLHFRSLIISDKMRLCHKDFKQDHNSWYYKMFFILLNAIFSYFKKKIELYTVLDSISCSRKS